MYVCMYMVRHMLILLFLLHILVQTLHININITKINWKQFIPAMNIFFSMSLNEILITIFGFDTHLTFIYSVLCV
jgi:hypothetical protein